MTPEQIAEARTRAQSIRTLRPFPREARLADDVLALADALEAEQLTASQWKTAYYAQVDARDDAIRHWDEARGSLAAVIAERDAAKNWLDEHFVDYEEDPADHTLLALVEKCFGWGDGAWYQAGKESERADRLAGQLTALREFAEWVIENARYYGLDGGRFTQRAREALAGLGEPPEQEARPGVVTDGFVTAANAADVVVPTHVDTAAGTVTEPGDAPVPGAGGEQP